MPSLGTAAPSSHYLASRRIDLRELAAKANEPLPWIVNPLVIAGTNTMLAAGFAAGKTWLAHEAITAVMSGERRIFRSVQQGAAVLIDSEMSPMGTARRVVSAGYPLDMIYFDAGGMNLTKPEHRMSIRKVIDELGPGTLVVLDSLRRMTPGADENSSEMGETVGQLTQITHDTGAAGLTIHHSGWSNPRSRGSSAIVDQVDACWSVSTSIVNGEVVRKVSCGGEGLKPPRYMEPPAPFYFRVTNNGCEPVSIRNELAEESADWADRIRRAFPAGEVITQKALAERMGANQRTDGFRHGFRELQDEGWIVQNGRGYLRAEIGEGGPSIA